MFHSARIKLTAWYLLIIMIISTLFSIAFYLSATREIRRIIRLQRLRIEQQYDLFPFAPPPIPEIDLQTLIDAQNRLKLILVVINGTIFVLAGTGGYFLAGRTLRPIQDIVNEQNRFVSDASHELRTPLTVLRSEIEVALRDKKLNLKDAKALLQSNLEEVTHLQQLSDNLLELSQLEINQTSLEPLDVGYLTQQVIKRMSSIAKQKNIGLINNVKNIEVKGNKNMLTELFVILIDNAIKYSPANTSVIVSSSVTGRSVHIKVKDQGIGIEKENLLHIFERFYRTDSSRSKNHGYGLGLSIAKKIVERHHGSISAKSTVDKGTTFTVTLPIH